MRLHRSKGGAPGAAPRRTAAWRWALAVGAALLLSGVGGARASEAKPARPNILWLIAEDFGPHLGCYGTKQVFTPNLDRLAAEGTRYTRFFTPAPVCSPSRSAFMTGMYQTTIGAHNHRSHRDDGYKLPEGVRVLTDWMRDAGYFTANVVHFPESVGFRGTGKTDWNFTYTGRPFDTDRWEELKAHQPFFAQVNFSETHRLSIARHGTPWPHPRRADPAKVEVPPYYPDHPVVRADRAGYLDAASELDVKAGKVLRQLVQDGLAENTIVVFFGDNGEAHVRGKQFCYDSGLRVPLIVRWPARFPRPRQLRPGSVDRRLLNAIDLAPTMLALAGAPKPPRMQGEIFLGDRAGAPRRYVFGARDRCDETVFRFRTVRDARYRYIRNFTPDRPFLQKNAYKERQYPVWNLLKQLQAEGKLTPAQAFLAQPTMPAEELYDLQADPHEIRNLAGSSRPEHRAALERLRGALTEWIETSGDQGRVPEPPEVAAARGATRPGAHPDGTASTEASPTRGAAREEGWIPLFNGRDLEGWVQRGGRAEYRVEEGAIVGRSVPRTPNSFLCTTRDFADFVLELEFKIHPKLNSGVQFRSQVFDSPRTIEHNGKKINIRAGRVHGYQYEIDPSSRAWTGGIYDEGRRGWLRDLKENAPARAAFRQNEWNRVRIEARGDSLRTWINDVPAAEIRDGMTPSGFIALQVHGVGGNAEPMEVRWRNLRLRELPASEAAATDAAKAER